MDTNSETQSFWQRQFAPQRTRFQTSFDIVFGIVVPILCLIFDPVVFRPLGEPAELGHIQTFSLFAIGFSILALTVWLLLPIRFSWGNGFLAGCFFTSALLSFSLGVRLLPLSLLGLLFIIGVAGFTPFLSAFVYFRNSLKAFRTTRMPLKHPAFLWPGFFGMVVIIGIPLGIQ